MPVVSHKQQSSFDLNIYSECARTVRIFRVQGLKQCATFSENREALKGIANIDDF